MLTETSYQWALAIYIVSAIVALGLFNIWLLGTRRLWLNALLTLPLAALLLTPAYIEAKAETMAPAFIVAAFQWLSVDQEAAMHALRPLGLFTAVAFVVGLVLAVLLYRKGYRASDPKMDLARPD